MAALIFNHIPNPSFDIRPVDSETIRYCKSVRGHRLCVDRESIHGQIVKLTVLPEEETPCEQSMLFVWTPAYPVQTLCRALERFFPSP